MAKPLSRSAVLARELLGMIARRELRPGDPIDLHALGRRHGVSRTVVREALADLGGKGLVHARPRVGTTVAPDTGWNMLDPVLVAVAAAQTGSASMLAEALELRRIVEPALAAQAARDATTTQRADVLRALRVLADAMGAADRAALAAGDAAFHDAIAAACGNRLLRTIDRSLAPVRALQRERLHAADLHGADPGLTILRCLALQTRLGLAVARRDVAAATDWAMELACAIPAGIGQSESGTFAARPAPPQAEPAIPLVAAPLAAPATAPEPAPQTDDWPATTILVRDAGATTPMRRGRLGPIEPGDTGISVPALIGDAPLAAEARAR